LQYLEASQNQQNLMWLLDLKFKKPEQTLPKIWVIQFFFLFGAMEKKALLKNSTTF